MKMQVAKTAPDSLKLLWKKKFFFKGKTISEVKTELEKAGYNFADSALANALTRSTFLTQKGSRGNYAYVQKHPFVENDENE